MAKCKKYYTDIPYLELAGYKKKSFILPYSGGEIFCEHLDGIYQYENAVIEKIEKDSLIFLKPKSPSRLIINLDETEVSDKIVEKIISLLNVKFDKFVKVAFVGVNKKWISYIRNFINEREHNYIFKFFSDYEKSKEWVIA